MLFREGILAALAAFGIKPASEGQKAEKKTQAIGEYCQGRDVGECTAYFGEGLAQACSSCPE